jgi:hypothetical protein
MSQTPQNVASPSRVACDRCGYSRNTNASRCVFCGSDRLLGAASTTPHLAYVPLRGVGGQTTRATIVAGIVLLALVGVASAQSLRAQGEARAVAAATATAAAVRARVALANAHVDEAERQVSAGQLAAAFSELDQALQGQPSLARAASLRQDVSARVTATALAQATQAAVADARVTATALAQATQAAVADARVTATALAQATHAAVAAEGTRSAQARELLAKAQTQRDTGDLAAALAGVDQDRLWLFSPTSVMQLP